MSPDFFGGPSCSPAVGHDLDCGSGPHRTEECIELFEIERRGSRAQHRDSFQCAMISKKHAKVLGVGREIDAENLLTNPRPLENRAPALRPREARRLYAVRK